MAVTTAALLNRLLTRARLRHLQVVVALAELGSLRRAGESIGLTQPAVTQVLADLERMLEVELFQRHSRGVRPTAAGAELVPVARRVLHGAAEVAEGMAVRAARGLALLRVAASLTSMTGLLSGALPRFSARHPGIQLQVTEAEAPALGVLLARGECDLAVWRETSVVPQGWVFEPLVADRLVVVCGPRHRLARRRRLALDDLRDETWLAAPVGSAARHTHEQIVASRGWPWRAHPIVTRSLPLTWALLEREPLVMVLPFSVVRQLVAARRLRVLPVVEPMPYGPIGTLVPAQDPSPAALLLAGFLRHHADPATRLAAPQR